MVNMTEGWGLCLEGLGALSTGWGPSGPLGGQWQVRGAGVVSELLSQVRSPPEVRIYIGHAHPLP